MNMKTVDWMSILNPYPMGLPYMVIAIKRHCTVLADKIMNHQSGTISGVAAVYQRHEFLDERKTALEAWSNYVQALMDDADLDNVVRIHDG